MSFSFITLFGCFTLDLSCFGHSGFFKLGGYFLPHFRKDLDYYLLKYFLMTFPFVFSSWTPMIQMLGCLILSQRSLRLSSFLLIHSFSFLLSASFVSTILSSTSLMLSSSSVILLLIPSRVLLISFIALFITD